MSWLMLPNLFENDVREHGLSLGEFKGTDSPALLKATQVSHIEEGIADLNNLIVVILQTSRSIDSSMADVDNDEAHWFIYTLIPKSEYDKYCNNTYDCSSNSLPNWLFVKKDADSNYSIYFSSRKRGPSAPPDTSELFFFNRPCDINATFYTIRFLSFEMFLTGDLAFLMTLSGRHGHSHVKCLLCDLQNSNVSSPNLAWQKQTSIDNKWTTRLGRRYGRRRYSS